MSFSAFRLLGYSLGILGSSAVTINGARHFFDTVEETDPLSLTPEKRKAPRFT